MKQILFWLSVVVVVIAYVTQKLPYPASRPAEPISQNKFEQLQKQASLTGEYTPNSILHNATVLFQGEIEGSESVVLKPNRENEQILHLLDMYGNIYKSSDSKNLEYLGYIGPGRPLGAHFDQHGSLIVCDSLKGLVQVEIETMKVTILANQAMDLEGNLRHVKYANDLDISSDGTIFFSSSTDIPVALNTRYQFYDTMWSYLLTMFHGKPTGFLAKYEPEKNQANILMDGIWYANGVAVSKNEDFVAVVETASATIYKYYLKGTKKGHFEILVDGLPGFPDGITRDPNGSFWIALIAKKLPIQLPQNILIRTLFAHIWGIVRPPVKKFGGLLNVDENGKVLQFLTDEDGSHIFSVSGVTVGDGKVYMGCLSGDFVSYIDKNFFM